MHLSRPPPPELPKTPKPHFCTENQHFWFWSKTGPRPKGTPIEKAGSQNKHSRSRGVAKINFSTLMLHGKHFFCDPHPAWEHDFCILRHLPSENAIFSFFQHLCTDNDAFFIFIIVRKSIWLFLVSESPIHLPLGHLFRT